MEIIHHARELSHPSRKVAVAIGVFDGVHLGHQQVLRQAIADARGHGGIAVAVTFDRHPNSIVSPDRAPGLIYSLPQKLRSIASVGLDAVILLKFDEPFSRISGDSFIRELSKDIGDLLSVCVGSTFSFGHKRSGNVALLKDLGDELDFGVHGLAAVSLDGTRVSSTRLREAITCGDIDAASQMLGRPYAVCGAVVHGDKLGTSMGFPTANLDITGLILPPSGVYAVRVQEHQGVMNIGSRPTLNRPSTENRVEVHLLDYSGDLYGQEMEVTIIQRLRDEKQFSSLVELQTQIAQDVACARGILGC